MGGGGVAEIFSVRRQQYVQFNFHLPLCAPKITCNSSGLSHTSCDYILLPPLTGCRIA
jgi:hypothetical protein